MCGRPTSSNEILQQLLQAFGGPGHRALGFAPTYSMYEIIGPDTRMGGSPTQGGLLPGHRLLRGNDRRTPPDIVFVTNPHSPTGHSLGIAELECILNAARESWGAPSPADSRRA
jgi:histidinol-phosphate aminotransferase